MNKKPMIRHYTCCLSTLRKRYGGIPQCLLCFNQHRSHIDPAKYYNVLLAPLISAQRRRTPHCSSFTTQNSKI